MKNKVFNKDFKTVIFDYDGTMFDTDAMQQYVGNTKKYPRFSPQWVAARKEYISHIVDVKLYDGWTEVFKFLRDNKIKAAIVSGNNREVLNVATKHFGLRDIFPKEKVNRIGCRDVNGRRVHKRGGYAWRKEYCGCAVYGYGSIMKKLAVMREKRKNLNLGNHAENRKPMCVKYHIGMCVHERSSCHVVNRAVVGCDCAVGGDCRTLSIGGENGLGRAISAIGFADTS